LSTEVIIALTLLILAAALLYSSVGHAGASGYLASMALFGLAPEVMKPTALSLNILVAIIATIKFYRAGWFSWPVFWPFAAASIPFAFLGGIISLPGSVYKPVVGLVLFYAAFRLAATAKKGDIEGKRKVSFYLCLFIGAGIGFMSGLTGVGGGIFLSPLLLLTGWAETKETAGVSAAFILVNSIAGLMGHLSSVMTLPRAIPLWAAAAVAGGWIGASYGSRKLAGSSLKLLLAVVLVIAGLKMMLG
jgi:hypothetical protein